MSVFIKGLTFPKDSPVAVIINPSGAAFVDYGGARFETLEAVDVPAPHGRLIDADELIVFEAHVDGAQNGLRFVPAEFIEAAPTIEAEPVKRGKWKGKPLSGFSTVRCSVCGEAFLNNAGNWNYCPNCGARMEKSDETD